MTKKDFPKFLLKMAILLIPFGLSLLAEEHQLKKIPNSYNTKKAGIEAIAGKIEVLALGSSQALYGIDPSRFSYTGFNLANSGQSLYYDKELTRYYLDRLPKLRCVIISISYFSLYYRMEDTKEGWKGYFYHYFWDIPPEHLSAFDLRNYSLFALYTPSLASQFTWKRFKVDLSEGIEANGFKINDTTGSAGKINEAQGRARVNFHDSLCRPANTPEVTGYLKELIASLRERKIDVLLVTSPVYKTYADFCRPDILQFNKRVVDSLCRRYQCKYLDYSTDPRFEQRDFADNDHLNAGGAQKFSRFLNEEGLTPMMEHHKYAN